MYVVPNAIGNAVPQKYRFLNSGGGGGVNPFFVGMNYVGMAFNGNNPGTPFFDYLPPNQADFNYYATKGIKVLRFSIRWEQAQNTLGGGLNSTYMGYVDNAFTYAANAGIKILLELFDEYQYGGNGVGQAGGPTTAQFADVWNRLSARYAGNPALFAYGLMNEPVQGAAGAWQTGSQLAITAIRLNDPTTQIYVGGENFCNTYTWVTYNDGLKNLTGGGLVFEGHIYLDNDSSGTRYGDWDTMIAAGDTLNSGAPYPGVDGVGIGPFRLAPFFTWGSSNVLKLAIGENGFSSQANGIGWINAGDAMVGACQAAGVPYFAFAGRWFDESYGYYFGPNTKNAAIDLTQMAVLTKYSGAAQPTAYFVTATSYYSPPSTASGNVTLYYRGILAANMVITPSDNGAGGTFTPATITLTAGYNPTATFTYTPPAAKGVQTISFTNNKGLTNAGAITFFSLAGMQNVVEFLNVGDASTIVKDGSNILQTLFDKSGNGYDATAGPDGGPLVTTIGGLPVLTFDGANQLLMRNTAAGNAVSAGARTLILVAGALQQAGMTLVHNANDSANEKIEFNNDGGLFKAYGTGGQQAAISNRRTYDTNLHIFAVRVDDTTLGGSRMWIDGQLAATLGQASNFTNHYQPRIGGNIFSPTHSNMSFGMWISIAGSATATQINDIVNDIVIPLYGGTPWAITDAVIPTMVFGTQITDTTVNGDIVPPAVTAIMTELQAQGGSSGGVRTDGFGAGSGSSGDFGKKYLTAVTPGQTFPRYLAEADSYYDAVAAGMVQHSGVQGNSSFAGPAPTIGTGGDINLQGIIGNNLAGGSVGGAGVAAPGPFTPNAGGAHNADASGPGASGGGADNNGYMGKGGPACIRYTDMTKAMLDENGNVQLNEDGTVKFNE